MKVTDYITNTINRLPRGYIFTYEDFISEVNSKEAIIKALNRMVASGKIKKLSKGKFYKPENTPFGELEPERQQVVKDLLEENDKPIGYLTGLSIYNKLGLTTQVSNTIQIGKNEIRASFKRGRYTISFIKQKNNITKDNIRILQLLDTIRYIKRIPDAKVSVSFKRLISILQEYSESDINTMLRLAIKYPPSTRALLGALLEESYKSIKRNELYKSLNPITTYKYPGLINAYPNVKRWNIK
jgi:hypothetical protein